MRCPKCDLDVSDSYQGDEPDVGIGAGWYCAACDLDIPDDGKRESLEDDVHVGPTVNFNGLCQYCRTPLEMGYGLAGGGMGPYMYCPAEHCGKTFIKSQEPR